MPEVDPQVFEWTWCLLPVIAAVIGWGTNHFGDQPKRKPKTETQPTKDA